MIISVELLRETERRYRKRQEKREEQREKIVSGDVIGANDPDLVQKRIQRIARSELWPKVPTGTTAATLGPDALPEAQATISVALERLIGKSDLTSVSYLELGMAVARPVARVHVRNTAGRPQGFGTGSMVSPRLLLTNNHVLGSQDEASNSWAEFNFQDDTEGLLAASVIFGLEPETFFLTDAHLDYTLVAVAERSRDDGSSLGAFGWNRLIEEQGKAIVGENVNIIQHPNGEPKQLALRENQIVDELESFLHYETDTAPGSSGSPVFNDQWEVIALHHSGVPRKDDQGRILTRDGNLWTPDMGEQRIAWIANEGARASRIVHHIKKQQFPAATQRRLRDEMFEAQPTIASARPTVLSQPDELITPTDTNPLSPSVAGDGSATWTLPLQVSVRLGQYPAPAAPDVQPSYVRDAGTAGSTPLDVEDSAELSAALAELDQAASRPYYDEEKDRQDREAYYRDPLEEVEKNGLFDALSELLEHTHTNQPGYRPSTHVYPWVDLRPNLKLQSIYSGQEFEPEELIREDFRIDVERRARLQELLSSESAPGIERWAREIDALEESRPYNCEHVVPQSWYDKREPMRGDLHHLFVCESRCNSFRGNIPYFDFEDFEEVVREDCGKREENRFEPSAGKGAVARATLYFLLRYPAEINRTGREYEPERLGYLLGWHEADPVSEYEKHRNMAIFEKQGNRNPLIDHPEWASKIDFTLGLGPA